MTLEFLNFVTPSPQGRGDMWNITPSLRSAGDGSQGLVGAKLLTHNYFTVLSFFETGCN